MFELLTANKMKNTQVGL